MFRTKEEDVCATTIIKLVSCTTNITMGGEQWAREQGDTGWYTTSTYELYQRELANA